MAQRVRFFEPSWLGACTGCLPAGQTGLGRLQSGRAVVALIQQQGMMSARLHPCLQPPTQKGSSGVDRSPPGGSLKVIHKAPVPWLPFVPAAQQPGHRRFVNHFQGTPWRAAVNCTGSKEPVSTRLALARGSASPCRQDCQSGPGRPVAYLGASAASPCSKGAKGTWVADLGRQAHAHQSTG